MAGAFILAPGSERHALFESYTLGQWRLRGGTAIAGLRRIRDELRAHRGIATVESRNLAIDPGPIVPASGGECDQPEPHQLATHQLRRLGNILHRRRGTGRRSSAFGAPLRQCWPTASLCGPEVVWSEHGCLGQQFRHEFDRFIFARNGYADSSIPRRVAFGRISLGFEYQSQQHVALVDGFRQFRSRGYERRCASLYHRQLRDGHARGSSGMGGLCERDKSFRLQVLGNRQRGLRNLGDRQQFAPARRLHVRGPGGVLHRTDESCRSDDQSGRCGDAGGGQFVQRLYQSPCAEPTHRCHSLRLVAGPANDVERSRRHAGFHRASSLPRVHECGQSRGQ